MLIKSRSGGTAKQIFDRAQLPNDILVRIWNLADTEQRGMLSVTEFIIAMHLLASYKIGQLRALPQTLPPGLYEAAARRGAPQRQISGSRPPSDVPPISAIPKQFSGAGPPRTSSPLARPPYGSPAVSQSTTVGPQHTGDWLISNQDKAQYDSIYATVDTENNGYITGDQAVSFFSNSRLSENDLAQIWDLADINSEGRLNRDEFAVAMYLIKQQKNKKDAPTVLPQALPQNLIPPSMRRQPVAPPQSTAPTFDNAANMTKPKSAAEDLFGLDAFDTPAPAQIAQSTGGSSTFTPVSPQPTGTSPQTSRQSQQSSIFKPFVPSSSFGQTIMTPQATGTSASSTPSQQNRGFQRQQSPLAEDDLLGDNDPEISKKLTQETTELANLSNQVGTLTNQMQQVKSKRASTEQDLSQVNSQKRDFEARLAQLRAAYEQEARDVKTLEDKHAMSRNDTRKVQQDIAMVEATYQDLRTQHNQFATALDADQRENASLKERMRQINAEINQMKPQLEKMKSDARQQKGLVAINKKQLSTNEAERDKVKSDLDEASKDYTNAIRELEESHRVLEESNRQLEMNRIQLEENKRQLEEKKREVQPVPRVQSPAAVVSPAPSTTSQSMNPFFRRTTTMSSERGMSQSSFASPPVVSPNHSAFDSFFGPSHGASPPVPPNGAAGLQTTSASLRSESPEQSRETFRTPERSSSQMVASPDATESPVSPIRHENSFTDIPPPPQSRQITSSVLPLRDNLQRSGSTSSSVKVSAPASRFGDDSGFDTPRDYQVAQSSAAVDFPETLEKTDTNRTEILAPSNPSPFPERSTSILADRREAAIQPEIMKSQANDHTHDFGQPSAPPDIPGSFPGDSTPSMHTPMSTFDHAEEHPRSAELPAEGHSDEHMGPLASSSSQPRGSTSAKDEFESAFADFGSTKKPSDDDSNGFPTGGTFGGPSKVNTQSEFPPIHEYGGDDESESDSDHGFEDSFTAVSPARSQAVGEPTPPVPASAISKSHMNNLTASRPDMDRLASSSTQPPTPGAQFSPPSYDQTMGPKSTDIEHRDSNQFPAEYGGLLPSREAVLSSPQVSQPIESAIKSPSTGDVGSIFGGPTAKERAASGTSLPPSQMPMSPGATAAPYAYTQPPPQSSQSQPPIPPKDESDDFDNDFNDLSEAKEADEKGDDEFGNSHRDAFDEFNPNFDSPAPSRVTNSSILQNSSAFDDFESSTSGPSQGSGSAHPSQPQPVSTSHDWDAIFAGLDDTSSHSNGATQPFVPPKIESGPSQVTTSKPALARALTAGTEHDDPILKV